MHPDLELWQALREALAPTDPVPPHVLAAARASLAWRDPDAALAALVADSALAGAAAGVRGAGEPRLLTFATDALTIEVEARRAGSTVELAGQLVPAGPATVHIDQLGRAGGRTVEVDALGRFAVTGLAPGFVRLACTAPSGGSPVRSAWVRL